MALITKQIIQIQKNGGFWTEVIGKKVCLKLWIHFIPRVTSGHNNLVGHMNGANMKYPYRDYKCKLHELSESRPKCKLVTLDEIRDAKKTPNGIASLSKKQLKMHSTMFGLGIRLMACYDLFLQKCCMLAALVY